MHELERIERALAERDLDSTLFERCAQDCLSETYPGLSPVPGLPSVVSKRLDKPNVTDFEETAPHPFFKDLELRRREVLGKTRLLAELGNVVFVDPEASKTGRGSPRWAGLRDGTPY